MGIWGTAPNTGLVLMACVKYKPKCRDVQEKWEFRNVISKELSYRLMKVQEAYISLSFRFSSMVTSGVGITRGVMAIKQFPIQLLVLIFFVVLNHVSAQQRILSLRPSIGIEFPMNHLFDQRTDKNFRYNNFDLNPQFALGLQYELNDRLDIFGGWSNGATGYSFAIFCPDGMCGARHSNGFTTQRFPIGVHWELKDYWLFPIQQRFRFFNKIVNADERLLFLVLFRLKATFGLSYNYISPSTGEDQLREVVWPFNHQNQEISHVTLPHVQNRHGMSLFGGLTLQFYNHKRDKVQLSLIYNQGILRQLTSPLNYSINGKEYSAQLGSRGSYFAATLSYPIRLATFGAPKLN